MEELMRWPWRRFEAMFQRYLLAKAVAAFERRLDLEIAAIHANTNYDMEQNKQHKIDRLEEIENTRREGIRRLYSGEPEEPIEDAFESDPLFGPVRRMRDEAKPPQLAQAGMGLRLLES